MAANSRCAAQLINLKRKCFTCGPNQMSDARAGFYQLLRENRLL